MDLVPYLIALVLQGLVFGALARLALPGRDPLGILKTIGVGVAGSFLGGLLFLLIGGDPAAGGFFAAFLGSVLVMYLVRRSRGGGLLAPDAASAERRRGRRY